MSNIIADKSTNDVVVQFDSCVAFGEAWEEARDINNNNLNGELVFMDASACPDLVNLSDIEFNNRFKDKIGVWMYPDVNDVTCITDFFNPYPMYDRMLTAGARGILYIDLNQGSVPGTWHVEFNSDDYKQFYTDDDRSVPKPTIPFIHCSSYLPDSGSTTKEELGTFFDNFYNLEENINTYPNGLLGNLTITDNEWASTLESTPYRAIFQGMLPLGYAYVVGLAIYFMYERVQVSKTKHVSPVTVPFMTLGIEALTCLIIALFLAIDGHWAVINSGFEGLRRPLIPLFAMITTGSSVLVGLSFSDFRKSTKKLRTHRNSFIASHRKLLIVIAGFLVGLEVVAGLLREASQFVYMFSNGIALLIALVVAIWFQLEAHGFASAMHVLTSSTHAGDSSALKKVLKHTVFWTRMASLTLFIAVVIASAMNFIPDLLWSPGRWTVLWLAFYSIRLMHTVSKVILCKVQKSSNATKKPGQATFESSHTDQLTFTQQGSKSKNTRTVGYPKEGSYYSNLDSKLYASSMDEPEL